MTGLSRQYCTGSMEVGMALRGRYPGSRIDAPFFVREYSTETMVDPRHCLGAGKSLQC